MVSEAQGSTYRQLAGKNCSECRSVRIRNFVQEKLWVLKNYYSLLYMVPSEDEFSVEIMSVDFLYRQKHRLATE